MKTLAFGWRLGAAVVPLSLSPDPVGITISLAIFLGSEAGLGAASSSAVPIVATDYLDDVVHWHEG
jgi:hypothetical protein